ncbi:ABC transporter permease subunit [Streptomyces sp. NPDC054841]
MTTLAALPVAEPRARFRDLFAAEWIKLWSLRSTPWSLVISALAVMAFNVGTAYDHHRYWYENRTTPADFIAAGLPLLDAFTTNAGIVMMLAAGAIGALAITGEYSTGLIRTTFATVPARRSVMAAKVSVITAVMTAFGAVVAAASFALTQAILSTKDAGVPLGHPGALRVVVSSALLAPLCALVGAALGTVVRHSAAAVVGNVAILQILPFVVSEDRHWSAVLAHALPFQAWMRLTRTGDYQVPFPWTTAGAWTVYAIWALAAATIAVTAVHRRDQ